jgi:hypothetical protein
MEFSYTISVTSTLILSPFYAFHIPHGLFLAVSDENIVFFISSMRATCPAKITLLDLITLTILGVE